MSEARLRVLAVLGDPEAGALVGRVLERAGHEVSLVADLAESLSVASVTHPQVVLVDVTMREKAGLAVVHHMKSLLPNAVVYALAPQEAFAVANEALSLGATGVLVEPLSGDELLSIMSDVRTKRALQAHQRELESNRLEREQEHHVLQAVTQLVALQSRREAGSRLASIMVEDAGAKSGMVYLGAAEGQRQLSLVGVCGSAPEMPSFCDEMTLLRTAEERGLSVIPLTVGGLKQGILLVEGLAQPLIDGLSRLVAAPAAVTLGFLAERELSQRGAMKDPGSSAYTFAYFVDVAGREIDKAVRHGRRFALATVAVPALSDGEGEGLDASAKAAIVERLLGAVRDTDVVARIDDTEFYVLLPETGGLGAHACRRRVMQEVGRPAASRRVDVMMGLATFPHDGRDLSQLLRVAKHRAQLSERSAAEGMQSVETMSELLDALHWSAGKELAFDQPQAIELPITDLFGLAATAVAEALRGGATRLLATQRSGMCMAAAVRAAIGRDREEARLEIVDIAQVPGAEQMEVLALLAEHGAYALLGRTEGDVMRAVHSADPILVDLIAEQLGQALHTRFLD